MQALQIVIPKLQRFEIFDPCSVKLNVVKTDNILSGGFGVYVKPLSMVVAK